jgi:hypothetical protein
VTGRRRRQARRDARARHIGRHHDRLAHSHRDAAFRREKLRLHTSEGAPPEHRPRINGQIVAFDLKAAHRIAINIQANSILATLCRLVL